MIPSKPTLSPAPLQQPDPPKADTSLKATELADIPESDRVLILSHQQTILSASHLARVLARVFNEKIPDAALPPGDIDTLSDQEKCKQLLSIVHSLNIYFRNSCIYRPANQERWKASSLEAALNALNEQQRDEIRSALGECGVFDTIPLELSEKAPVLLPGATIPRMDTRLQSIALKQTTSPETVMCLGSQRPLDPEKDVLPDEGNNHRLQCHIDQLVKDHCELLGDERTEAHAYMGLLDDIRESNPECVLNNHPVYFCFTGALTYQEQSVNKLGEYELGRETTGRANSEATFRSALTSLQQLYGGSTPEALVYISNQPHISTQQLALERVAALPEINLPVSIQAFGDGVSPKAPASLRLAIDTVRKSIELLTPSYHVTTNWVNAPECKLFKSERPGVWTLVRPELLPSIERLI